MSSKKDTTYYMELQPGDAVQEGDQWLDEHGQWQSYGLLSGLNGVVGYGVRARRPIGQVTYEEVPGSRTTQQAIDQPQRERIAYEELRPGDVIQAGDEHRNADGRWHAYDLSLCGSRVHGAWDGRARRPYKISAILEIGDALANAQRAATQLQDERDEARNERDLARAEVARLSTELWARKPLEERVTSLTEELAQAREANQQLLRTIADNADQFSDAGQIVEQERDEARAERDRLQEVVGNLYNEPTARQVQDMLRTWATELDWSAGCFGSFGRSQIDIIQQTMVAVIERIESIINPEGDNDDN